MESGADPGPGAGAGGHPDRAPGGGRRARPDAGVGGPPGTVQRVPNWHAGRVEWCVRIERPEVTVRGFDTHREDRRSERARLWQ